MKKILIVLCCMTTFAIAHNLDIAEEIKAIGDKLIQQHHEKVAQKTHIFAHAVKEAPGYSFAHSNLAQKLLESGNSHEAVFQAKEALRKSEDHHNCEALLTLGIAYRQTGQFELAIDTFKKVIDWSHISNEHLQKNRVSTSCYQLAMVYSDLDRLDYAAFYYKRALKLDQTNMGATNNLAYIFYNKGRYTKAKEVFEDYIMNNPYKPMASLAYAFMLRKMRDQKGYEYYLKHAAGQFERIFKAVPFIVPAKKAQKELLKSWRYLLATASKSVSTNETVESDVLQSILRLIKEKLPELAPQAKTPVPPKEPTSPESPQESSAQESDKDNYEDDSPYG